MATPSLGPIKEPKCKKVTITLVNGEIKCSPDPFDVSKSLREDRLIFWQRQPHGPFSVDFNNNGTPFYESHFDQDNPCSGLVRRDVPDGSTIYKYTVTVDGHSLDPGGRVDP